MYLAIHGGGYVGLTDAVHYALAGCTVMIYDPNEKVIENINNGKSKAEEYLGYIDEQLADLVAQGKIKGTTDFELAAKFPVQIIGVPSEKDGKPDMTIVNSVVYKLLSRVPDGATILIESTLTPGTTRSLADDAMLYSKKIYLAVVPRTDWFADKDKNLANLPRIIGGINPESTAKAKEVVSLVCHAGFYETTAEIAELVKAGQNALYFVQIAAAHDLAKAYPHLDMNEVLRLISTHWRLPNLYLGPGVSGRCVPSGPQYLMAGSKFYQPLMEQSIKSEKDWRREVADAIVRKFPGHKNQADILILGIAYRPNFTDTGYSAGLWIAKYFRNHAWNASVHDSCLNENELKAAAEGVAIGSLDNKYDAILLATAHNDYKQLPEDPTILWKKGTVVFDATGEWEKYRSRFYEMGVEYFRVGEPNWDRLRYWS